MEDQHKTKELLINELAEMRQRIAELEASEAERKRAEEALRESEEKFRTLAEQSPNMIFINKKGRVVYANARSEEVMGYTKEEFYSPDFDFLTLIAPEYKELVGSSFGKHTGGEEVEPYEYTLITRDGRRIETIITTRLISYEAEKAILGIVTDITDHKRAEEEIRQRTAQLEALREVGLELTAQLDLDNLLRSIVSQAVELLGGNSGALDLYRPECDMLEWAVSVGMDHPSPKPFLRRGEGLGGKVWETGEPLIVDDYHHWEGRRPGWEGYPFKAVMGVPVRWGEEFLGVLQVSTAPPRAFSPADAELLSLFATQAAIAIRNARLYEETRSRAERLAVINRIAHAVGSTLRLDDLAEIVYQETTRVFQADAFFLALYDPETNVLDYRLRADEGIREPPERRLMQVGLTAQVITSKKPLLIRDFEKEKDSLPPVKFWGTMKVSSSWLGVPMHIGERVTGVICVQAYRPQAYGEEEQLLLSTIADQVAVAVENARLYEETQRRALEQETVSRIAYALNTPDVRDAFPVLVEGLRNLTGCDMVNLLVMDETGEHFIMSVLECPFPMPGVGDVMPLSATAATKDIEAGRPHLTVDLSTETHFPLELAFYQAGLRSQVTLPLLVGGEVFGVLNLGGSQTGIFRENQLPVLRQIADAVAIALENGLLFQGEREQRELAESLEEAAAVVSSTLDPDQVLDRILEQVSRVVPNDATNIMLIEGDQAHVVRWRGYERFGAEEIVSTVVFRIPEVPGLQQMLENREPMVIPDTATYPGWVRGPVTEWLRSYAAAPIIVRGKVIGFLNVDSVIPGFFTQTHAEGLRVFADHAAAAIENARLYEAEQKRRHIAETLRQASAVLSSTLELDQVLRLILQQLRQVIPYDSASVQRLQGEWLEIVACEGFEEPDKVMGLVFLLDPKFPNYRVVTTKVPLAIEDVVQDYPHFKDEANTYESGRIRSWLGVPLMVKDQVIGMIALDRAKVCPYTVEEAQLAMAFANQAAVTIENARLFEEEKRRSAQLVLISEVGDKVASILDLDRLIQEVPRSIQEKFNYYNVALFLLDESRREVVMQSAAGGFEHIFPGQYRQALDEGIIGFVARSGSSWLANDIGKDPYYVKGFLEEVLTQSELCVPIKLGDKVIGALDVQSIRLNDFDQADVAAMEAVADQVAIAIENARLYDEAKKRAEEMAALHRIGLVTTSTLDLDEVLRLIYEQVSQLMKLDTFYIALYDEQKKEMNVEIYVEKGQDLGKFSRKLEEGGLTSWIIQSNQPLLIRNTAKESFPTEPLVVGEFAPELSYLGVPLIARGKVIGVISVQSFRPYVFDEGDQRFLSAIANQAAIAIENARLFQETQRRAEEMAALREVSLATLSTLERDQVFEIMLNQLGTVIDYDTAAIKIITPDGRDKMIAGRGPIIYEQIMWDGFDVKDNKIMQEMRETRQPVVVHDTHNDERFELVGSWEAFHSWVGAPLFVRDALIGYLMVEKTSPGFYDEKAVQLLDDFARAAAIALENAKLFEETRQRALQLQTVEEVGRRASAILDLDELLPYVAKTVQQSFGYYHVDIFLVDRVTGYVVFKASNDPVTEKVWKEQDLRFKVGKEGMVGWVAHTGEPLLANDVSQEPHYLPDELLPETKSELVVPLKVEERVVGILDVESDKLNALDENDIFALQTLAGQIAIAIENARLYEETQRQSERLAQTLTLSELLHRDLELEQVLEQIAQGAVRLGFRRAVINVCQPEEDLLRAQAIAGLEGPEREELMGATYRWSDFQTLMQERFRVSRSYLIRQGEVDWEKDFRGVVVTPGRKDRGLGYWRPEDMLLVPLWGTHGQPVGLLSVDEPVDGLLPDLNTIQTLEAFANQAAIAIENARLFGETERLKAFNESVVQGVAEAILIEDAQGILTFANPTAEELLGYTREELTGLHWSALTPENEVEKVRQEAAKRPQGIVGRYETVLLDKKGQRIPVIVGARPLFEEGKFVGVLSAFTDITERKQAEREIEERRMYLEGVLGAAPDAIVTLDARHRVVEWNAGAERLFGYSREEVIGRDLDHLITNTEVFEEAVGFTQIVMNGKEVPPVETVRYRKDGSHVHVIVAGSPILVGDELVGVVAVYTDITERKRMEEALRASLLVDELTGLYNRRGFSTLGQQQLKTADRAKSKMLLLFADFDELKRINDALGHSEGDLALIEIASALKETFRESDIIARIGGDEFVVLAIETDGASAEILTTRLQENLEARNAKEDRRYKLSLSVGIARYDPKHPCSIDELLARADRLMYEQKQDSLEP
jgi:diguanylate cyclase (GGDEF)-like protein/PAS domain S-box-containing protein